MTTDTHDNTREHTKLLFWSTPESANAGRFTVLALLETLAATSIVLGLVAYTGDWKLVLVPAAVAPLLLLRTEASTEIGVRLLTILQLWTGRQLHRSGGFARAAITYTLIPFFGLISTMIKIYSTTRSVLKHPLSGIESIPRNWWRVVLATDAHHPPELVPGVEFEEQSLEQASLISFSHWRQEWSSATYSFGAIMLALTFSVLWFLPALFYRWSLKSTAILYLPLIWILQPLASPALSIVQRLKLFAKSDMVRIAAVFSVLSISLFLVKLWLWNTWTGFADWLNATAFGQTLSIYIEPTIVPPWQWGMFINSCLMIGLFLYVRSCIRRDEVGAPVSERTAANLMTWGIVVRRILTGYTMLCTFYITARLAMDWNLPPLGNQLFPWQ